MESEYVRYQKSVGMSALFEKSHKNTRTKISATPYGVADIFILEMGLERAAPVRRLVQKVSGGHLLDSGWTESTPYAVPFGTAATSPSLAPSPQGFIDTWFHGDLYFYR